MESLKEYEKNNHLKLCPFCAGEARVTFGKNLTRVNHEGVVQTFDSYVVECKECGCRTFYYKEIEDAVEAWNKRAR